MASPSSTLTGRLVAFALAQLDRRNPWVSKLLVLAAIAYAISPIDLIPDLLPVVGFLDDVAVVPLGLLVAAKLIPNAVWVNALEQARREARKWIILGSIVLASIAACVGYVAWVVIRGVWAFMAG